MHARTHAPPPRPPLQLRMRLAVQKANTDMMDKDLFLAGT